MDWAIRSTEGSVEFWSSRALPFEGGAAAREVGAAKAALRSALGGLVPTGVLIATWTSADATSDAENVLLYNVGVGAFSDLSRTRLVVRRVQEQPVADMLACAVSHHRYEVENQVTVEVPDAALAVEAQLPRLSSSLRAAEVWAAVHRGSVELCAAALHGPLAARITLRSGHPRPLNLAAVSKPIVDGLLAALHGFAGPDEVEVAARAARQAGATAEEAAGWLRRSRVGGIGEHRFVHLRGDGLQWTPADDRLVLVDVVREQAAGPPSLDARIWSPGHETA